MLAGRCAPPGSPYVATSRPTVEANGRVQVLLLFVVRVVVESLIYIKSVHEHPGVQ